MSNIYLDACVVNYFVEKHPAYYDVVKGLINSLSINDTLYFSPLVRLT